MAKHIGNGRDPVWLREGDLAKRLTLWNYWVMMRQRNISQTALSIEMGVTPARVQQLFLEATEEHIMRIDEALTAITDKRGGLETCLLGREYVEVVA